MGMTRATPWAQELFGPQQLPYNPQPATWEEFQTLPQSPAIDSEAVSDFNTTDNSGEDPMYQGIPQNEADIYRRDGTPYLTDKEYWGNIGWTPDIGAKDVAKAYGPYMARGLSGGFGLAARYMNPTKDPLFQKAASQYLAEFSPGTSLAGVLKDINRLYALDPTAKTHATDTARGILMGYGPLGNMYDSAVMNHDIMDPWGFAQQTQNLNMMGFNPMEIGGYSYETPTAFHSSIEPAGNVDMTSSNVFGDHEQSPLTNLARNYVEMRQDGDWNRSIANPYSGGYSSKADHARNAVQHSIDSANERQRSRDWMESTLNGNTNSNYSDWHGNNNDGGDGPDHEGEPGGGHESGHGDGSDNGGGAGGGDVW